MATAEQIAKRLTYDPVFAIGENVRDMLAAHIAQEIKREREACAVVAENACLVPPDGGSPTKEESEMCDRAAAFIRARSQR